jgi:hypothetical protein
MQFYDWLRVRIMVFSDIFINISFLRLNLATVPIVWYCFVSFYFLG